MPEAEVSCGIRIAARRGGLGRRWRAAGAGLWWVAAVLALGAGRAAASNVKCLACHTTPTLVKAGAGIEIGAYKASVHGKLECVDCHADLRGRTFPHGVSVQEVKCQSCHGAKEGRAYWDSAHGRAVSRGDPDAPRCWDCHGTHAIAAIADPSSAVFRAHVPEMCGRCHSDPRLVTAHRIPKGEVLRFYRDSVHGRALARAGLVVVAVCTDCHGVHGIKAGTDPMSSVNRRQIPETCGKCHLGIYRQYEGSIHGRALAKGVKEAPVCTDCHGEHTIRTPAEERSSVSPLHVARTCSSCHENARIQERYGLPARRLASYVASYHGVANKYGDITVANCATCHGAHAILPSSDPRSSVSKANLPHTCGRCHPRAGENFAKGSVHVLPTRRRDVGVYWVRVFYQVLVGTLVIAFLIYMTLDFISRRKRRAAGG